jgi:hypothetical protein
VSQDLFEERDYTMVLGRTFGGEIRHRGA